MVGLSSSINHYGMSDFESHPVSAIPGNLGFTTSLGASAEGRYIISSQTQHTGLPEKRRKMSKPRVSPILKRAVSTPQMAGLDEQDPGGLSPSALDKRRNKLGYQRISIACGESRILSPILIVLVVQSLTTRRSLQKKEDKMCACRTR